MWIGATFATTLDRSTPPCTPARSTSISTVPWGPSARRSLEFEFRHFDDDLIQPCVQINYPDARKYTRSVEFKHVTGQHHPGTVVMYEYPRDHGDPYYPVPAPANRRLHGMYKEMAERETRERHVYFCGRLAEYRYINTDTAIRNALDLFDRIGHEYRRG
ncbi:MAG: hypothetical protein M5U09_27375 [Gammaproteobacteria bacterium]|nr:hypothetical protein [Gammaproteobacteria bacterium]